MKYNIESKTVFLDMHGRSWSSEEAATSANDSIKNGIVDASIRKTLEDYLKGKNQGRGEISIKSVVNLILSDKLLSADNIQETIRLAYRNGEREFVEKYSKFIAE